MAAVAFLVLGMRNRSWCVITASSPLPVPNLKVMTSGFFFLEVILRMEVSWCRCFSLAHPALSESSRSTTRLSAVSSRWLEEEEGLIRQVTSPRTTLGNLHLCTTWFAIFSTVFSLGLFSVVRTTWLVWWTTWFVEQQL